MTDNFGKSFMIKKRLILFIVLIHCTCSSQIAFSAQTAVSAQIALPPEIKSLMKLSYKDNEEKDFLMVIALLEKSNPELITNIRSYVITLKTNDLLKAGDLSLAPVASLAEIEGKIESEIEIKDNAPNDVNSWSGETEMNILLTSGKKDIEYYGIKSKLKKDMGKFHHLLEAYFDLNKTDEIKNKEKFGLAYKIDFDMSKASYLLGLITYEADGFGPFKKRLTTSVGMGYHIFNDPSIEWKLEGGPSLIMTTNHIQDTATATERLNEFSARASSIFAWKISKHTKFTNNLVILAGKRNLIESKSSLKFKILGALHSKFSYDILYDKDAPIGSDNTNTVFRTGLLFEF
jgi:putative salt-induced outer membrane protein YdiY